jgi:protein tyrosine phosphatase
MRNTFFFACSGGTGRTGTIILVDQCLKKLNFDNKVDVFKIMDTLRRERVNAVENFVRINRERECLFNYSYIFF